MEGFTVQEEWSDVDRVRTWRNVVTSLYAVKVTLLPSVPAHQSSLCRMLWETSHGTDRNCLDSFTVGSLRSFSMHLQWDGRTENGTVCQRR